MAKFQGSALKSTNGGHTRTTAHVVRAGSTYALIALPGWLGGAVLAHVPTWELTLATSCRREDLPGTWLTVLARLNAVLEEDLDLHDWHAQAPRAAA
jgi:hypothetical protein